MSAIPHWKKAVLAFYSIFLAVFLSGFWFFHHHENQAHEHEKHASVEISCDICDAFFVEKESFSHKVIVDPTTTNTHFFLLASTEVEARRAEVRSNRGPPSIA